MKEKDFNNKISEGWFSKKTPEQELKAETELISDYIDQLINKTKYNKISSSTPGIRWEVVEIVVSETKNENLINQIENINMYFSSWPEDWAGDSKADARLLREFTTTLKKFKQDFQAVQTMRLKKLQSSVSTQSQTPQPSTPQQQPKQPQQQPKTTIQQPTDKDVYGRIEPTLESIKRLAGLAK